MGWYRFCNQAFRLMIDGGYNYVRHTLLRITKPLPQISVVASFHQAESGILPFREISL